jgi:hypothetical protein
MIGDFSTEILSQEKSGTMLSTTKRKDSVHNLVLKEK